jgi:hypothetical protein
MEVVMRHAKPKSARLQAYRDLYVALCTLSDTLYQEALTVSANERDAAFVASCALIAKLEQEQSPASPSGLLGRIDAVKWGPAARRTRSKTAHAP